MLLTMTKSIQTFLDEHGRVSSWPSDRRSAHQRALLEHLRHFFQAELMYSHVHATHILEDQCNLPDVSFILHELVDAEYLTCDETYYWRSDVRPKGVFEPQHNETHNETQDKKS